MFNQLDCDGIGVPSVQKTSGSRQVVFVVIFHKPSPSHACWWSKTFV